MSIRQNIKMASDFVKLFDRHSECGGGKHTSFYLFQDRLRQIEKDLFRHTDELLNPFNYLIRKGPNTGILALLDFFPAKGGVALVLVEHEADVTPVEGGAVLLCEVNERIPPGGIHIPGQGYSLAIRDPLKVVKRLFLLRDHQFTEHFDVPVCRLAEGEFPETDFPRASCGHILQKPVIRRLPLTRSRLYEGQADAETEQCRQSCAYNLIPVFQGSILSRCLDEKCSIRFRVLPVLEPVFPVFR